MKKFSGFSDFDEYFYQLFSKENNIFSQLRYRDIPIGQALQHNVYDYFRSFLFAKDEKVPVIHNILSRLRIYGYDHAGKYIFNRFLSEKGHVTGNDKIIFFSENFVPRILNDFLKIFRELDGSKIAFCTTDYRAYKYVLANRKDMNYQVVMIRPGRSNRQNLASRKKLVRDFKSAFLPLLKREFGDHVSGVARIIKANLGTLADYYDLLEEWLADTRPQKIILGSDGFSVSRMLCFAAKKCGIKTYVMQHGLLDSFNGYFPLVADYIFLWSNNERQFFQEKGISPERLLVSGSPRFDFESLPAHSTNDIPALKQILFVISPASPQEVYDQMDTVLFFNRHLRVPYKVVIRPHPYYRRVAESYFKTLPVKGNIFLDDKPFLQSLHDAELVVFVNISTGIYEALAVGKSSYVLQVKTQGKLGIYNLPKIEPLILAEFLNEGRSEIKQFDLMASESRGSNGLSRVKSAVIVANNLLGKEEPIANQYL